MPDWGLTAVEGRPLILIRNPVIYQGISTNTPTVDKPTDNSQLAIRLL